MFRAAFVALAVFAGASAASAATIQNFELRQNQWAVLDLGQTGSADLVIDPISEDGSFSFTYAFSDSGCGAGANQYNTWSCMPKDLATNTVMSSFNHNFGEGWFDKVNRSSVTAPVAIAYLKEGAERLFMYFRVTSGSGTISQTIAEPTPPAPVPLPAGAALLPMGLAALALLKRRRRQV
ncbi:hypothetical protein [Falsirhodobacter xinxiangensis]|uniref:hypothetical protein n=1 Tax=Falsirhodobacter xinxiangensis TaxID=2530049 RepID=UPI0010A9A945|nr:hypothetical protein [Rhodobacter xinxiangensis]